MANPRTVKEAVDRIIETMSEKEKKEISRMPVRDLPFLHHSVGRKIRNEFGLITGNKPLTASCASYQSLKCQDMHPDDASQTIIIAVHARLVGESKNKETTK